MDIEKVIDSREEAWASRDRLQADNARLRGMCKRLMERSPWVGDTRFVAERCSECGGTKRGMSGIERPNPHKLECPYHPANLALLKGDDDA